MPASPSLRRRRLAAELRKLRDQSGLSINDVADKLGWAGSILVSIALTLVLILAFRLFSG